MKTFIQFLKDFIANKGLLVFVSFLVSKSSTLITTVFIARMISKEEYGLISIGLLLLNFIIPFNGFGSYQGLLRFGMLTNRLHEKEAISYYTFRKGSRNTIVLGIVFLVISFAFSFKYEHLMSVSVFLFFRLIGMALYQQISIDFRIRNNNKMYALLGIFFNVTSIVIAIIATYYFKSEGYVLALSFSPFLVLFFAKRYFKWKKISFHFIPKKEFWNYSIFTSLTYFLSEWVMMTDHFMVSLFFDESSLASYRIASLIPFNLLFLSKVFIQTDFPKLAKNYQNKAFLLNYYTNYLKLFIPIAFLIILVGYVSKDFILPLVFGSQYQEGNLFFMLLFYTFIAMIAFVPLGNILVAVGEVKKNTLIAITNLIVLSGLCIVLIPHFQLKAIPIAVITSFSISSLMSVYFFRKYIKGQ